MGLRVVAITIFALVGAGHLENASADSKAWSNAEKPSRQKPQAIGKYSAGCLSGGVRLPKTGSGYQVMRLERNRMYGHPTLVKFIKTLGKKVKANGLGQVMVGDLALPRGGPTLSQHVSHQNGLDVDFWFYTPPEARERALSDLERENVPAKSVLTADKSAMDHEVWNPGTAAILRLAAQAPAVERILVNPRIKKELCETESDTSWLYKLRPTWGHADHFHVRLACPNGAARCVRQSKTAKKKSGCAKLGPWLARQSKREKAKALEKKAEVSQKKPVAARRSPPKLPRVCRRVISARAKKR